VTIPDQSAVPCAPPSPHRARRIGVLYAPGIAAACQMAGELAEWLTRRGLEVWRGSAEEGDGPGRPEIAACDILLTLGGDGTALRAAHLAAPLGVPLVCVGMGHLSFMAELTPEEVLKQLPAFLSGDYWLEERSLLEGRVVRAGQEIACCLALNEIVLGRERCALTLRVAARLNGDHLITYVCDAVIVATATGSTAYAVSAGGPIVFPTSPNILLLPVAAHLSLLPPLIIPPDAVVELKVVGGSGACVNADGQPQSDLLRGDLVRVQRSAIACYFARRQEKNYFFRTLKARLYRENL
jgi:NAD+ kinase